MCEGSSERAGGLAACVLAEGLRVHLKLVEEALVERLDRLEVLRVHRGEQPHKREGVAHAR